MIGVISSFMFQITFEKLILVWFWYSIKEEYLQLSGNSPPFSNYYLWEKNRFSSYTSTMKKYSINWLQKKKCKNTTIFGNDIKEISTNVKQCHTFHQNFSYMVIFQNSCQ